MLITAGSNVNAINKVIEIKSPIFYYWFPEISSRDSNSAVTYSTTTVRNSDTLYGSQPWFRVLIKTIIGYCGSTNIKGILKYK